MKCSHGWADVSKCVVCTPQGGDLNKLDKAFSTLMLKLDDRELRLLCEDLGRYGSATVLCNSDGKVERVDPKEWKS